MNTVFADDYRALIASGRGAHFAPPPARTGMRTVLAAPKGPRAPTPPPDLKDGNHAMNEVSASTIQARLPESPSAKLRAALDYLGDRLSTHPASRFRPQELPLLEAWLAMRRAARSVAPLDKGFDYRNNQGLGGRGG